MITVLKEKANFGFEWVYVTNPNEVEILELVEKYQLHRAWVKDCMQPEHLPKYEHLGTTDFIILRRFDEESPTSSTTIRQVTRKIAVFYSDTLFITIHRAEQPFIMHLKEQYVDTNLCQTTFHLLHKLIDFVMHTYEKPANDIMEQLTEYEAQIFTSAKIPNLLEELYTIKRRIDVIRRTLFLSKDILNQLRKMNSDNQDAVYIRDTVDLYVRLETIYDTVHENTNHLLNIYFSVASQRTNEIVRLLTIFSVFFMPLTFIVGVYGMNFKIMPELEWEKGYSTIWGIMIAVTVLIFIWFKRKKWL